MDKNKIIDLIGLSEFKKKIINLIPTKTSQLENDSNFKTTSDSISLTTSLAVNEEGVSALDAAAGKVLNDKFGGCRFEQEGEDFFIVGADAVRKKLGDESSNQFIIVAVRGSEVSTYASFIYIYNHEINGTYHSLNSNNTYTNYDVFGLGWLIINRKPNGIPTFKAARDLRLHHTSVTNNNGINIIETIINAGDNLTLSDYKDYLITLP